MTDNRISNTDKAEILSQALPYIQEYYNKVVVIKYGGNAMVSDELKQAVMSDLVLLSLVGIKVVLVHGGGPEVTEHLNRLGMESRFIGGLRHTDKDTAEIVQMVLAGKTNKDLVALLQRHGGSAIGLCGLDAGMITAEPVKSKQDLGYVGEVKAVNTKILTDALDAGYIPVIATVGVGEDGCVYNINADTAAAAIASALKAANIILMTDIRGLLRDKNDPGTLIQLVKVSEVPYLIKQNIISDGMIPKVNCCVEAVRRGVPKANIIDGRIPHSILIEILSKEGAGTMFVPV